jgi:hypothetical protein
MEVLCLTMPPISTVTDVTLITLKEVTHFCMGQRIHHLSVSIQGSTCMVAVATEESNVRLCDLRIGVAVQACRGHLKQVRAVQWSPIDANVLFSVR